SRPPPAKRKTIFDDDSGPEDGPDEEVAEVIDTIGGINPTSKPKISKENLTNPALTSVTKKAPQISHFGDLSTNHSTTKHATTAQSLDPNIYDYDSVYDSLHAKPKSSTSTGAQGPKYMGNLLAAAEVRKRDQLRAKEKMLLKEREAEGEEFADKEKFVTGAYKAQQEEVRKLELEEVRREQEEEERRRKEGGGLTRMYKNLLEQDEQRHAEQMKAAKETNTNGIIEEEPMQEKEKSEVDLAKEKGALINDEGQIVDKRQLLSAGLNFTPKPKPPPSKAGNLAVQGPGRAGMPTGLPGRVGSKQAMRERQTRMLEAQLEEAAKRAADDDEVQREAMERAAKSRKTEGDISSAKE
ncbi:MAG: hypothetical protein Q9187_009664, partial [Circinaria calcarea]